MCVNMLSNGNALITYKGGESVWLGVERVRVELHL